MLSRLAYEQAAHAIATVIWSASERDRGATVYLHFAENDLEEPCDMLERLGAMEALGEFRHVHAFRHDWNPGRPLELVRHPGEPPAADLVLALGFYAEWFPHDATGTPAGLDEPMPPVPVLGDGWTPGRAAMRRWAMRRIAALLAGIGLGSWADDGRFRLSAAAGGIDGYRLSKDAQAAGFGGDYLRLYPPA
ncbi:MAG: hypothetical protein WDN24_02640 [Sphingomonas sp.]